jgi:hypothetical protein
MIFYDGILVPYDIFMVEIFENINLFFDSPDVLLANGYFLHSHQYSVVEVDAFIYLSVGSFTDFLDQLVALDSFVFRQTTHSIINIISSFRNQVTFISYEKALNLRRSFIYYDSLLYSGNIGS